MRLRRGLKKSRRTGCWRWTKSHNEHGYGTMGINHPDIRKRLHGAHRVAAWLWLGVPLEGKHEICHSCDVKDCCNPRHLLVGTRSQNQKEAYLRGKKNYKVGELNGRAKLTWAKVERIRKLYATGRYSQKRLARAAGVSQVEISKIVRGKSWNGAARG